MYAIHHSLQNYSATLHEATQQWKPATLNHCGDTMATTKVTKRNEPKHGIHKCTINMYVLYLARNEKSQLLEFQSISAWKENRTAMEINRKLCNSARTSWSTGRRIALFLQRDSSILANWSLHPCRPISASWNNRAKAPQNHISRPEKRLEPSFPWPTNQPNEARPILSAYPTHTLNKHRLFPISFLKSLRGRILPKIAGTQKRFHWQFSSLNVLFSRLSSRTCALRGKDRTRRRLRLSHWESCHKCNESSRSTLPNKSPWLLLSLHSAPSFPSKTSFWIPETSCPV